MNPTSIASRDTRIIPAQKPNQAQQVTKNADGSMCVNFKDGTVGTLDAGDKDLQAFVIWTMLNPECRR